MSSDPGTLLSLTLTGDPIAYAIEGAGPPLILLHAGIADSRMWLQQVPAFARSFRVLRYDLRGFGASARPAEPFSHHQDLRELMLALNIDRAHILGLSLGASIAIDFVLSYPDMVDRLVICSALGPPPRSENLINGWTAAEAAYEQGGLTALNEVEMSLWVDGPHRSPDQVKPEVRAFISEMNFSVLQSEQTTEHESTPADPPAHERLSEIRVRTLVLTGDIDQPDILDYCGRLAREIPDARLEIIPGASHMVNMEAADRFNRLVIDFLTG